jgi:radical SAM superfamily enzyme
MESGSDAVLKKAKKGTDKATQILAGQKIKRAEMELSEYFMPGLGGRHLSRENALETADALNRIDPDFIRLRTLALPEGTPLAEQYQSGEFVKMGEFDVVVSGAAGNFPAMANDLSLNGFKAVVDIDLRGTFHNLQYVLFDLKS